MKAPTPAGVRLSVLDGKLAAGVDPFTQVFARLEMRNVLAG
jgi:hypothetical protein